MSPMSETFKFNISKGNSKIKYNRDIITSDELKKYMYEGMQDIAQLIQAKGRSNGSSGDYYKNWTGKLTRSINAKVIEYDKVRFFNNLFYSSYIEYGTGIYATNGTGRHTPWTYYNENYGQWVTTLGSTPRPFMSDTLEESEKDIEERIDMAIIDWWEGN